MKESVLKLGISDGDIDIYYPMCSEQENAHIVLLGKSGSGKSVAKEELKKQLAERGKKVIEIDYSDSTLWRKHSDCGIFYIDVKNNNKISLFERYYQENGCPESDIDYCSRIVEIVSRRCKFRERQKSILLKLSTKCLVKFQKEQLEMSMIVHELQNSKNQVESGIYNKLFVLSHIKAFNTSGDCWDEVLNSEKQNIVFDLSKFNDEHRSLVSELLLENLKRYLQQNEPGKFSFQLILDECKELGCKVEMPLDFFLTQGRKYGCGLLLATQTLKDFDSESRSKLLQASLMLNFLPSFNEIPYIAKLIADKRNTKEKMQEILAELEKGECIANGRFLNEAGQVTRRYSLKIKIHTDIV